MYRRFAAAAAIVLGVAGCSHPKTVAEPQQGGPASTAASTRPSPTRSAFTPPSELNVGASFTYTSPKNEKFTTKVLGHKNEGDAEGVEVRSCNTGSVVFTVSRTPWVLLYDGGDAEQDVDVEGGGLPAPAYPDPDDSKKLTAGKCVQGWINWEEIAGKKPYGVAYRVENDRVVWKF